MKIITGEYNKYGYQIFLDGKVIYIAGNNKYDSQSYLDLDSKDRLTLSTIRKFCIQTAKDIAEEKKAEYCGVEKVNAE